MSGLRARLRKWPEAAARRLPVRGSRALAGFFIVVGIVLPFFFQQSSGFLNATIIAIAYAVMSLGLNVVVGFAGLLDLGYVAFYALGAYSCGVVRLRVLLQGARPRAGLPGREHAARHSPQLHPGIDRRRAHLRRRPAW